jgi:hypothetical protein
MNELLPQASLGSELNISDRPKDAGVRGHVIRFLQYPRQTGDIAKNATARDAFRVIMIPENAFVENVKLERIPPDCIRAVSDLLYLTKMAAMEADLRMIKIRINTLQSHKSKQLAVGSGSRQKPART